MVFRFINVIFFMEDSIEAFYENVCTYLEMKSETLNFARYLSVEFCIHLFLHNLVVLTANLLNNILYLMYFALKLAKQKVTYKLTTFLFFCCT